MPKFRKKPVVIEAVEVRTANRDALIALSQQPTPLCLVSTEEPNGLIRLLYVEVSTREGIMRGDIGDMIIKGVQGELYPCKPDIFAATYEAVD